MDAKAELMSIKDEYIKLQDHLANVELKYQTAINIKEEAGQSDDFDTNLHHFLSGLFNQSKYSDMEILLEDGHQISAHKVILASRSEYWGVEDFQTTDYIDLADIKYAIAHDVIKWVYTGTIVLNTEEYTIEILKLAVRLRLKTLVVLCEEWLIPHINEENCKEFLQLAVLLSTDLLDILKEHCYSFIKYRESNEENQVIDEVIEAEIFEENDYNNDDYDKDNSEVIEQDIPNDITTNIKHEAEDESRVEHQGEIEEYKKELQAIKPKPKSKKVKKSPKKSFSPTKPRKSTSMSSCPVCDEKFTSRTEMRLHKSAAHPGDRPYHCEFCEKTFKKRCAYKIHIRTHTGEKPYICPHCGRGFHDSKCCRSHILTHDGQKPFMCNICGRSFIMRGVLNTHMKQRHFQVDTEKKKERFMCSICGNSFTQKGHLHTHEKIHFGVKAHQCSFCGKSFVEKSAMTRHVRTHTGEKPHKCQICGNSFIQMVQLRKHMVKHDKQNALPLPLPVLPMPQFDNS